MAMIGGGVVVASIGIVLFAKVAAMPEVIKFGKIFFIQIFDKSFKFSYNFYLQPIEVELFILAVSRNA